MGVGEICNVVIVLVSLCKYIQTCANAVMFLYVVRAVRISDKKRTHCKANRQPFTFQQHLVSRRNRLQVS